MNKRQIKTVYYRHDRPPVSMRWVLDTSAKGMTLEIIEKLPVYHPTK